MRNKLRRRKPQPTPALKDREAYSAWAHFYERLDNWKDRSEEDRAVREAELTRLYGEPGGLRTFVCRYAVTKRASA